MKSLIRCNRAGFWGLLAGEVTATAGLTLSQVRMYSARVLLILTTTLLLPGCGSSDEQFETLERDLSRSLNRFESFETQFGSSASWNDLIVNAGLLDRMAEEVHAIERIESQAVAMGSVPIPEIREEIAQRFRRRLAALKSDAAYLNVMSELKIAEIWLEI